MLSALAAALDGTGPAILPLDPALPEPALAGILTAFAPAALHTMTGTRSLRLSGDGRAAAAGVRDGGVRDGGVRDDTAVVLATSGSTGEPKAVELSAAALIASAAASLRRIGAGPGERWLCCLPTFHIAGLGVLVRSLIAGLEPVIVPAVSPEILAASGCAHISLVPTQLRRLLDAGASPGPIASVLLGGAPSGDGLLAEARTAGWRVITTYGMSETCGGCVYDGVALDDVAVRLRPGGEIEISGAVLFSGYLGAPDLTASALRDGWFHSADLGWWRTDGRLGVRGRADEVINTGGEKVVPGDVEAALGTHSGVADVVVLGLPDPEWGEAVTAFVVAADPAEPPDLAGLRSAVREAVSVYAAPKRVVVVPEFPLLPSGKPDRAALRRLGVQGASERPSGR
ncbi:MAG TPA: AMP-binding protein [Streptosporangiaceae bacterium]|nr:AMP-binding protein [Streptosporangiaceae bacterium]